MRNLVHRLRRKLHDDPADPAYIVSKPRVGYRMPPPELLGSQQERDTWLATRNLRFGLHGGFVPTSRKSGVFSTDLARRSLSRLWHARVAPDRGAPCGFRFGGPCSPSPSCLP